MWCGVMCWLEALESTHAKIPQEDLLDVLPALHTVCQGSKLNTSLVNRGLLELSWLSGGKKKKSCPSENVEYDKSK